MLKNVKMEQWTCCGGSVRGIKLEIFGLIEAYFVVRSGTTDYKIAEKQSKKINF
jgi:hypothetical protein